MPNYLTKLLCSDSSSTLVENHDQKQTENHIRLKAVQQEIPISGNAFITEWEGPGDPREEITEQGLEKWSSAGTVWSIFFRLSTADTIQPTLRLRTPRGSSSSFKYSWGDDPTANEVSIPDAQGGEYQNILLGRRDVEKGGYMRIDLQGVERSGNVFANNVTHCLLSYGNEENEIIFNTAEDYYWGRRGPSIHMAFPPPPEADHMEYYYNEVTIPEGGDAVGLYAMACGFQGGYFGMQVNSSKERRILFSVWSEYKSDDPAQIPADYRVSLIDKGPGVIVGQFGGEGTGAQSYIKYNWTAGVTYKFLLHGRPIDSDNSLFTAWFKRPDSEDWDLIASFRKPKVSLYLLNDYCFLENFNPDEGYLERRVCFGNQWALDKGGEWHELVSVQFTGDATAKAGRRDFAGGVRDDGSNVFYLRHCGFFDETVPLNQSFERVAEGKLPDVDIDNLP